MNHNFSWHRSPVFLNYKIVYDPTRSILGFSLLESSERLLLEDKKGTRALMQVKWAVSWPTNPSWNRRAALPGRNLLQYLIPPLHVCTLAISGLSCFCALPGSAALPVKLCLQVLCYFSGDQTESSVDRSASIIASMELLNLMPFPQILVSVKFSLSPKWYALKLYYLLPHW